MSGRTEGKRDKVTIDCLDRSRVWVIELPFGACNLSPTWSRYWVGDTYYHRFGYTYDLGET